MLLQIQKVLDNMPSVHHHTHETGVAEESRTIMQLLSDIVQRNAGLPLVSFGSAC